MGLADVAADVSAEPGWLHTLGQVAGTLLLLELVLVLVVVLALMLALAYGAWWLHAHVVPVVNQYGDQAIRALRVARRGGERVARGVAAFHGRVEGAQATLRTLVLGTRSADRLGAAAPAAALPAPEAAHDAEALAEHEHPDRDGVVRADGQAPRTTGQVG